MESKVENSLTLSEFLAQNPDVRFIDHHWVDLSGVLRTRVIPKVRALKLDYEKSPIQVAGGSLGFVCLSQRHLAEFPRGVSCYRPDWRSLRLINPTHASVLCNLSEEKNHPLEFPLTSDLRCPRSTLSRVLSYGSKQLALTFLAGFELEFYIFEDEPNGKENSYMCWSSPSATRGRYGACLDACVQRLLDSGIEVEQFHPECGEQQYEISTGPLPVLQAVDTAIQSQEIIKSVCSEYGLRATFSPKPFDKRDPSGLHMHLSLHPPPSIPINTTDGDNLMGEISDHFLAGILENLRVLVALANPSEYSYERLKEIRKTKYAYWGTQNRDTPIRRIEPNHWEFREVDATANLYLAAASHIAAGISGIQGRKKLSLQDCLGSPADVDFGDLWDRDVRYHLPVNMIGVGVVLSEAREAGWPDIGRIMGREMLDHYQRVKVQEDSLLDSFPDLRKRQLYLHHF